MAVIVIILITSQKLKIKFTVLLAFLDFYKTFDTVKIVYHLMNRMTVEYLALPRKGDFIIRQTNKKNAEFRNKIQRICLRLTIMKCGVSRGFIFKTFLFLVYSSDDDLPSLSTSFTPILFCR